ncbi:MAG: Mur ligase family protein, partial [Bacteroidota bacterium]
YPAYIYEHSKNKKRVVIAGSHGKTTTTSMILHVLKYHQVDFDYLVGAQIEGFELMARLSDAPIIIMEGDEYPSSPTDLRPKIHHYFPHLAVITGIAWDHMNVFPTFENYKSQFEQFLEMIQAGGKLYYYERDEHLGEMLQDKSFSFEATPYQAFNAIIENGKTSIQGESGTSADLQIFGNHNLSNLKAAFHICKDLGISEADFFEAIASFKGAAKRLQLLREESQMLAYLDFAHAPSKVEATIKALKAQFPDRELVACLELHTFSSLNKAFLPQYAQTMDAADHALVFFSEHTLEMKRLPKITKQEVAEAFQHPNIQVFTETEKLQDVLLAMQWTNKNLLMMSSGTFGGIKYEEFAARLELHQG